METLAYWLYGAAQPEAWPDLSHPSASDTLDEKLKRELFGLLNAPDEGQVGGGREDKWTQRTRALVRRFDGSQNRVAAYVAFELQKKRGGSRTIHAPVRPLKGLQRRLAAALTAVTARHGCAHGFEPERTIVTNARAHVRKRWVYTVDLEDFFPSITWARVYGMLQRHPVSMRPSLARLVANLATREGVIPQGAPTSPVLANLVCRRLDARLHRWARERGYVYTRYADDLTFSTNRLDVPQEDCDAIEAIIEGEGFRVNPAKRRLMPHTARQMVTGLVVNRKVNLPKHFVKGLRALLTNVDRYGWESQTDRGFAFETWAAWEDSRAGRLGAKAEAALEERQRKGKLLLNPRALIPSVARLARRSEVSPDRTQHSRVLAEKVREQQRQVRALQRVVAGRLAFLRMVRGEDYPEYQRLREHFEYLRDRDEAERKSYDEHRQDGARFDAEYTVRKRLYQAFGKGRIGRLTPAEFDALVAERAGRVLEFHWLEGEGAKRLEDAQQVAYHAYLCSPRLTGGFAAAFKERTGFEGLLHRPPPDAPPAADLVARARGQVKAYQGRIPNALYDACIAFLDACQARAGEAGWHPMLDEEFFRKHTLPFRQRVRFGSDPSVTQLHLELEEAASEVNARRVEAGAQPTTVHIEPCSTVFTDTVAVTDAVRRIFASLVEKTTAAMPAATFEAARLAANEGESLARTALVMRAPGAIMSRPPVLTELFGGDMKAALRLLRGYADWTFVASFADGRSYQFDVMRNERVELSEPVAAATHTITLYRAPQSGAV